MTLKTEQFIDTLVEHGYTKICSVPCSFAKFVINAAINHPEIEYIPCASEAVACSIAAGLKLAGEKPLVIIQSSGLTNTGSCITSLLKPYGVRFPIITSWRTYKPGDSEVQHQHLATELPRLIEAYGYNHVLLDQQSVEKAVEQIDNCNEQDDIIVLQKDTFSSVLLASEHQIDLSAYPKRSAYLQFLNNHFKASKTLFIGTTGTTAREMYSFMSDTHNFYMAGNMGGALSVGLGAAKAGREVVICGGDAEFAMHLGGLLTAGRYQQQLKMTYLVFDNQANKSTGGQPTLQEHVDYRAIAKAANWHVAEQIIDRVEQLGDFISSQSVGLNFAHIKCAMDEVTPRPPREVVAVNRV